MTNESTGGVSKRSLILLGAFAALALNRDLRRNLILGTRGALDNAQSTLNDNVMPALSSAAQQAQHAATVAAHQAGNTWESLREDGPQRAQSLLGTAQEVVGTLAATAAERAAQVRKDAEQAATQARKEYGPRLEQLKLADLPDNLRGNLLDATEEQRYQARKALKKARRRGMVALADLGDRASTLGERASALRDSAAETVDDHRADAMRAIARARKDAEKELRGQRKNWNKKKLERAIEKRIAPVHQQVQREFVRLEKEAGRKGSKLQAQLRPAPKRGMAMGGGATTLILLGTGAVVLARVPAARQGILSAVDAVSPEAAQKLHAASRQARDLLGAMWLEDMEGKPAAAAGAAPSTQAATTGASAAAVVEPGSSAASQTPRADEEGKNKDGAPKN